MDTTDPDIQFDENGVCNHCKQYMHRAKKYLFLDTAGQQELKRLIEEIKAKGKGKNYDCIVGVSGGVDSTFVAYNVKKLGLRPLAVHVDNGWDSELAISNIKKCLKKLNIDLYTYVPDWEEFRDLQISFLKASVPDAELPTDHAIGAVLYQTAAQKDIPAIISGTNLATEGILPSSWVYSAADWKYIQAVGRKFGRVSLRSYPHYSLFDLFYYGAVKRTQRIRLLDYIPYVKKDAMQILEDELGWKYYGGKHYESIYTRFFQGYILPKKFNIDKRKAHLSTLICSDQMTREEALEEMKHNPYTEEMQREDMQYVIEKLGLTEEEFEQIMALPVKKFSDYPNNSHILNIVVALRITSVGRKLGLLPKKNIGSTC